MLNLIDLNQSDIKYKFNWFPDGEVQIELEDFDRKNDIEVKCRITNSNELFIIQQVCDILDRQGVVYVVKILYLMGMRMDRVMDFNRPFTLKVIYNILSNCNATRIEILEPHSGRIFKFDKKNKFYEMENPIHELIKEKIYDYQLIFPDEGAILRYEHLFLFENIDPVIYCEKVRDIRTGNIVGFEVINDSELSGKPLLLIDDLCDGGRTFVNISKELKSITDVPLNIIITHLVNPKGLINLSENFDNIWITNSYKDWKNSIDNFPNNIIQINV